MGRQSKLAVACFVLLTVVSIPVAYFGWPVPIFISRLLWMPTLIWFCLASTGRPYPRLTRLVIIALVFSWLGDLTYSVAPKIGFFLVAQLIYIAAFWPTWRRSLLTRPKLLIPYVLVIGSLLAFVVSQAGSLAAAVAAYGISLALMAVLATGVSPATGVGGTLFLFSDIVLAFEFFVAPGAIPHATTLNLFFYLPAQFLIVLGASQYSRVAANRPTASIGEKEVRTRKVADLGPEPPSRGVVADAEDR